MLVVECDCGNEVPFYLSEGSTSPVYATCGECGQHWKMKVGKVDYRPGGDSGDV